MRQLDGDYQPLVSSRGVRCPRDIVQFVPFNQFKGHADALAAETLKEIPHQVTDYFALKRIVPQAAIEIPLPTGEELPMAQVVAPPPPPRPTSPPSAQVGKALFMGAVDSNQYYRV
ncbi:hypothetical protein BASA81_007277 [Batrachochytrium salamandrivorans]|nr:hypothetical protein BASA81_007277 [Batrachochytrium salamandrivorans]